MSISPSPTDTAEWPRSTPAWMQDGPVALPAPREEGVDPMRRFRRSVKFTDVYSPDVIVRREIRNRNRAKAAELDESPDEEESAMGPEWLFREFRRLFEEMEQRALRGNTVKPEAPAARSRERFRIRPVAHEGEVVAAKPMELFAPEIKNGRLCFSCPACRHVAVLPIWFAGKKSICPRCYSAIRAPHPGKNRPALSLQNTVEALLHPERFLDCRNAHRFIFGLPRPHPQTIFHVAALLVTACLLGLLPRMVRLPERMAGATSTGGKTVAASPGGRGWGFQDRAKDAVEKFLAAETVAARTAYVMDADRVGPLMAEYYQKKGTAVATGVKKLEVNPTGFPAAPGASPFTNVQATLADGKDVIFTVEHTDEGDRIDWEAAVGYAPDDWRDALTAGDEKPKTVRVMAAVDDYYNYGFAADRWLCLRLEDQDSGELIGYGYLDQHSEEAVEVVETLAAAPAGHLTSLILKVKCAPKNAGSPQLEIVECLPEGELQAVSSSR